jgi:hypothetical protein
MAEQDFSKPYYGKRNRVDVVILDMGGAVGELNTAWVNVGRI